MSTALLSAQLRQKERAVTEILNKIPVSAWVLSTAEKMEAAGVEDSGSWSSFWVESYNALGGNSSSGGKPCPKCAAYGLWYLGWLRARKRPALSWSINEVRDKLGKNAAYAAIAFRLLEQRAQPQPVDQLWKSIRREFKQETGGTAAKTRQGAVKLGIGLFLEGKLAA